MRFPYTLLTFRPTFRTAGLWMMVGVVVMVVGGVAYWMFGAG